MLLKLYWRRFVNRKDWEPTFSLCICIKHFEEKYYKKSKNSTRHRLVINMKPVATIFEPKKELEAVVQRCSVKKGVLKNFAKFTGKYLCQSLFSIKLQTLGLQLALIKFFQL